MADETTTETTPKKTRYHWHPDLPEDIKANLVDLYGGPKAAAEASTDDLYRIGGMSPRIVYLIQHSGED